jgi:hypothetical protein
MSRTAAEVVRTYFADFDGGDDDEGFVLASDVGGRINFFTGSHRWVADARHALPQIEPALKQDYYAFPNAYRDYQLSTGTAVDPRIMETTALFGSAGSTLFDALRGCSCRAMPRSMGRGARVLIRATASTA